MQVMEKPVPSEKGEALSADRNGAAQASAVPSPQPPIAFWEWNLETNRVFFSFGYRRQLGAAEPELTNGLSEWENLLHAEDRERVTKGLLNHLANSGSWPCYEAEYRLRHNGTYRWMLLRAEVVCDPAGRPCRILGYQLDITEQKRTEAETRQANERLQEQAALLELAPVLVRDMENRIVLWTRGAERLYGFPKAEALGRVSHELFQTEFAEGMAYLDEMLRRVGQWEGELVHRRRNGEQLVVASRQIIYRDPAGRPIRILEVNTDITERKCAEQGLRESQAQLRALATRLQQAREEEAIRIARELHDQLGRCLTAMKMDIEGIKHGLAGDLAEGSLRGLVEKAERMNQTLDETVYTVRRISGELRPGVLDDLGLAAAIEWQARDFQGRSGVSCVLRLPEEELILSRDQATALFRVFQESLTNVARHARATKVWVNLSEEEGRVVLAG